MIELMKSGVFFANGVKESHIMKVANVVIDFIGIAVST
jgi:hypothetical protein